jgi:glycerophosphoryl diester phosphodiesterase
MRKLVIFILAVLSAAGSVLPQSTRAPLPAVRNAFVVIAHRGNHVKVPENTVASVKEAILCGADYVEMDLRTTKDGWLVMSHDASVDRMTNGKGNVRDLSLEQIKKLKVRGNDSTVYRIPLFKEILNACKQRINLYLDFKDADPEETYRQIRAAGMEKQVVVYLNKEEQYTQWKKTAPAMPLMGSVPKGITTPEQFRRFLSQVQLEVLDNVYDTTLQTAAGEMGVALWPDVESDKEGPAVWDQALAWRIQGMQTDHPEALVNYLKQRKRRNGPAGAQGQK